MYCCNRCVPCEVVELFVGVKWDCEVCSIELFHATLCNEIAFVVEQFQLFENLFHVHGRIIFAFDLAINKVIECQSIKAGESSIDGGGKERNPGSESKIVRKDVLRVEFETFSVVRMITCLLLRLK